MHVNDKLVGFKSSTDRSHPANILERFAKAGSFSCSSSKPSMSSHAERDLDRHLKTWSELIRHPKGWGYLMPCGLVKTTGRKRKKPLVLHPVTRDCNGCLWRWWQRKHPTIGTPQLGKNFGGIPSRYDDTTFKTMRTRWVLETISSQGFVKGSNDVAKAWWVGSTTIEPSLPAFDLHPKLDCVCPPNSPAAAICPANYINHLF